MHSPARSKSTALFPETNQALETTLHRAKLRPKHLQGSQLVNCLVSAIPGTPRASQTCVWRAYNAGSALVAPRWGLRLSISNQRPGMLMLLAGSHTLSSCEKGGVYSGVPAVSITTGPQKLLFVFVPAGTWIPLNFQSSSLGDFSI